MKEAVFENNGIKKGKKTYILIAFWKINLNLKII